MAIETRADLLAGHYNPHENGGPRQNEFDLIQSVALVRKDVRSLTDDTSLDRSDSGKVIFLDKAAGLTVTLPSVADAGAGWNARIVVSTNCTSNDYIITENTDVDTDILVTQVNELETDDTEDGPSSTGHTVITLGNAVDTVGDFFDIVCSGTKFFVTGQTALDGGAALT